MVRPMSYVMRILAMLAFMVGVAQAAAPTAAEAQSLSDESVRKLMAYAWAQLPERFTKPNGNVVSIDKKGAKADKKIYESIVLPLDVAREVIIAGRRSALAQLCDLEDHQIMNYRSLMLREDAKKKWNEQQMVYMNVLHLTVVQIFAGEITIKQVDEQGKTIVTTDPRNKKKQSCTEAEGAKLKEQIEAYVKTGPNITGSTTPAANTAQPAKKK